MLVCFIRVILYILQQISFQVLGAFTSHFAWGLADLLYFYSNIFFHISQLICMRCISELNFGSLENIHQWYCG